MIARRLAAAASLAALWVLASAHVGTLDTFFAGRAGPWDVQVTVRPPGVVPGRAQVLVRVAPTTASKVTVQAAQWDVGSSGAPSPDLARRVPSAAGLWSSELWLMTPGSYALHVVVDGPQGVGTVTVPVASLATKRLGMQRPLGIALLALGAFLLVGLVSIVGAAFREGELSPGEAPDPRRLRRARLAMGVAGIVAVAALSGGWTWWNAVDREYARGIFKPIHASAAVRAESGGRVLRLALDDSTWLSRQWTPLVPDHGKMMHLFLVREPALDAFAHLHPSLVDSSTFDAALGTLPGGRYRLYADVVHESGLTQTITSTVSVPTTAGTESPGDADDAIAVAGASGDTVRLGDGATVVWRRPATLAAHDDQPLRFEVRGANGAALPLEPYMGMPAHAVVSREDGAVFMHLHAMGSISPASQQVLEAVERGDTLVRDSAGGPGAVGASSPGPARYRAPRPILHADTMAMAMPHTADGWLTFPFSFPEPGRYRIWVQMKRGGRIETATFRAEVGAAR